MLMCPAEPCFDRTLPEPMATRTRDVLGVAPTVLADRGYFSGEQILACEQAGITTLVPSR
jgi:transposase